MKIQLKKNSKTALRKGDYYFAGENLILNCPFCGKRRFWFGPMNVDLIDKKGTIVTMKGSDHWMKCCKYFKIVNSEVIEMK